MSSFALFWLLFVLLIVVTAIIIRGVSVRLLQFGRFLAVTTVPQNTDPAESENPISPREALITTSAAAVIAFLYALCFSGRGVGPQLSFALFCPTVFIVLTLTLISLGRLHNARALYLFVPIVVVASFNTVFTDDFFAYGNVSVAIGLFTLFLITAVNKQFSEPLSLPGLKLFARAVFGNWTAWLGFSKTLAAESGQKFELGAGRKILRGILLALPLLALLTALLMSADMVFVQLGRDLWETFTRVLTFDRDSLMFIVTLAGAWVYFCGYIGQSRKLVSISAGPPKERPRADVVVGATFLGLVNLLFLAFSWVQVAYLFTGGLMTLPPGIIYSQYAREGFFQLLAVTVINLSLFLFFLSWLEGVRESRGLRFLLFGLGLFTSVLIASSFYRLFLYIEAYGYTALRLRVITFLSLEILWVIIAAASLFSKRIPFGRAILAASFIFYPVSNVTGSHYLATKLNLNLFLTGRLEYLDVKSHAIGVDGLGLIKPLMEDECYICQDHKIRKKGTWGARGARGQSLADIAALDSLVEASKKWQNWSYFKNTFIDSVREERDRLEREKNTTALRGAVQSMRSNMTPLAQDAGPEALTKLIESGADVNARDKNGTTVLMDSVFHSSNPEVIRRLIKGGAAVDFRSENGWTPLMTAVQFNKNPGVITTLIENGADVNARNQSDETVLMLAAAFNDNPEIITTLIKSGAEVNARGKKGWTPLLLAAEHNRNPEVISALIKAGAEVNVRNPKGETVLMLAAQNRNPDGIAAITTLLKNGADVKALDSDGNSILMRVARSRISNTTPEVIAALVKSGADVNARSKNGETILEIAARNNHPDVVAALIKNGADAKALDDQGNSALMRAAQSRVSKPVKDGADIDARDEVGRTALMIAVSNNNPANIATINALIKKGADVNGIDNYGNSVLMWAAQSGSSNNTPEIFAKLIEYGANVNARNQGGVTALMFAASVSGNTEVLTTLMENGANVNARDEHGWTPLMNAVVHNSGREIGPKLKVIATLIEYGAEVKARDKEGQTPLMLAAKHNGRPEVIAALIEYGAEVNARDRGGETPLLLAARYIWDPEVITTLIKNGAEVNVRLGNGQTPLMLAVKHNRNPKIIVALIENGADAGLKDKQGRKAMDFAEENPNYEELKTLPMFSGRRP